MNDRPGTQPAEWARFRTKLLVAMITLVTVVLVPVLFFAQRNAARHVEQEFAQAFQGELTALRTVQAVRHAALAERCRALARKPRLHAALEDNALDLLYPSARDELLDIMEENEPTDFALRARFYRFLDGRGAVIAPPATTPSPGTLSRADEAQLALPRVPARVQTGYLRRQADGNEVLDEVIAMPIFSTETGEPIAALALGFKPFDPSGARNPDGVKRGVIVNGTAFLPALSAAARSQLEQMLPPTAAGRIPLALDGNDSLVFYNRLNPDSLFPPAYEVVIYPLAESLAAQRRLLWQFAGIWAALLATGLLGSHFLAARFSSPVEKLAQDSEVNRSERRRAEVALETTHEELQRSARFSSDASHQLKTPVTILRVGLEELLADEKLSGEVREEVSTLVHQTFRLTSVIEDLLLLSRMDAGRLKLELVRLDLAHAIAASLDDLGALPDTLHLEIATDLPPALPIDAEGRYVTIILQNLLENARKYNRAGGTIRVEARAEPPWAVVTVRNTGQPIEPAAQPHIFARFHRGTAAENVPGHGLGLNLARQLARLHQGDLRLLHSAGDWTEFELRFRLAPPP